MPGKASEKNNSKLKAKGSKAHRAPGDTKPGGQVARQLVTQCAGREKGKCGAWRDKVTGGVGGGGDGAGVCARQENCWFPVRVQSPRSQSQQTEPSPIPKAWLSSFQKPGCGTRPVHSVHLVAKAHQTGLSPQQVTNSGGRGQMSHLHPPGVMTYRQSRLPVI